jgi:hypothetical protein
METQVKKLVDISGVSDPDLKKATVQYILKNGLKRPLSKLIALVGHPCAQEQVEKINSEFPRKMKAVGDETDPGTGKPLKLAIIDMMSHNAAVLIGEGFDIALKDNLQINSVTGQVVVNRDSTGKPDDRFLKCAAAEIPPQTPIAESDPYKGSQQGRSRKHKKRHIKKTLRRIKKRRNMH